MKNCIRLVLIAGLFLTGCQQSAENPLDQANQNSGDGFASGATTDSQQVAVKIQDWDQTKALIAQHQGKIVVLDLWSTYCEPCMREFPDLVALHQKYGNDRVVCISGSCDFEGIGTPEESHDQVLEFLQKQNATFENILFSIENEELWKMLRIAAIPVVYVYGPDGEVAKRFDNEAGGEEFTYKKDIIPFVEELLAAAPVE